MVLGVIDGVDTDGVEAKFLEVLDVSLAEVDVGNGVDDLGGTTLLSVRLAVMFNVPAVVISYHVQAGSHCQHQPVSILAS